ncbi:spore maturation protein [Glaciecola sp. MH2013]|uniref:nucleoside recognition domain-containing protein n=1 Tax=Glaciecola sp. MH2013 TaxID=2785524 RepID=UPI00189D75BA|nr:spore maturation protein [Glaciecola sp. MH2013]MBF7072783.1 spore maturation protein [Glaciecola sp. MH2013]
MLHRIWLFFIISAFLATCVKVGVTGDLGAFEDVMNAVVSMAKTSVDIAIGLIGLLAFWLGIFKVAENAGLIDKFSKVLAPLLCRIMPGIPRNHPALGSITMNMSANVLGLDNAATPFGIKAMQDMQSLAPVKDTLTNAQILFLVLNTSSVTLFPIAVFLYRAEQGAAQPTDVFIPILLATSASTLVGLFVTCAVQRVNLFNKVVITYLVGVFSFLAAVILYFSSLAAAQLAEQSSLIANFLLLLFIVVVLVAGYRKKHNTYDLFVDGAKQGFEVAITIIPFLLAMLFAIGMLRASGLLEMVMQGISYVVSAVGFDTRFVDAIPNALMKPLSGSGARALMIETMQHHGADSFAGRLASVMQGSTETTFYVLAVYLGAVGIKHSRYAVGCCLAADGAGILTAIAVSYWFFA